MPGVLWHIKRVQHPSLMVSRSSWGDYWVHSDAPRLLCQVLDHCFNLATLGDDFDTFEWMLALKVCIIDFYHLEILQKTLQNSAPLLVKLNETIPSWFGKSYSRIPRIIAWTISLVNITAFQWDLVELDSSPLHCAQHKWLRCGKSCATFSVGKVRSFPRLVSYLDYIWQNICTPSTNWTLPCDIPMSPDVTRAKKQQNPKLLLGRHVPMRHVSDKVVGLLLG